MNISLWNIVAISIMVILSYSLGYMFGRYDERQVPLSPDFLEKKN